MEAPSAQDKVGFDAPMVISETRFRKDHPNGLRRVHPNNWILQLTVSGKALVDPGPDEVIVGQHDAMLYEPGVLMHVDNLPGPQWHHRWVAFKLAGRFKSLLDWPTRPSGAKLLRIRDQSIWQRVISAMDELEDAFFRRSPVRRMDLCFNLLHKALLWLEEANPRAHAPAEDPRILQAVGTIKQDYANKLTVESLASEVHLSPSRFAHLFRQVTGTTPMRYLETVRLDKAQQMLLGSRATLFEIARACGFCNEFYFSNVFHNRFDIRPDAFRRRARRHRHGES